MAVSVSSTEAQEGRGRATSSFWALTLGSIGVVFGDIGTSPLYAFREAVGGAAHGQPVTRIMVLGVLSLILWALFTVVTAKYVLLLLRADNNGEGGTLSLMALGQRAIGRRSWPLLALGVVGASMFIGDSMITPAISVLSAVEGLEVQAPAMQRFVIPLGFAQEPDQLIENKATITIARTRRAIFDNTNRRMQRTLTSELPDPIPQFLCCTERRYGYTLQPSRIMVSAGNATRLLRRISLLVHRAQSLFLALVIEPILFILLIPFVGLI